MLPGLLLVAAAAVVAVALLFWQLPLLLPPWIACLCVPGLYWFPRAYRSLGILVLAVLTVALLRSHSWHGRLVPIGCELERLSIVGEVRGLVAQRRSGQRDYQRFDFAVRRTRPEHCAGPRRLLLYSDADRPLSAGDQLVLESRLRIPWGLRNPGVASAQTSYFLRDIHGIGSARLVADATAPVSLAAAWDRLRDRLSTRLRAALPGRGGELLAALLIGDRRFLNHDDWLLLRLYGVTHLLVISGMHISLAAAAGWLIGDALARLLALFGAGLARRWTPALLSLVTAAGYTAMSGFGLPALRALLMLLPLVICGAMGRVERSPAALAVAVLLLLLWDPRLVMSASFWLSAGAVALLLWALQWQRPGSGLRSATALHGYMALAMLPLSLFWFGGASTLGAALNLVAVPVISLWVVPIGLLGLALSAGFHSLAETLWIGAAQPLLWLWQGMEFWEARVRELGYTQIAYTPPAFALALLAAILWPLPLDWRPRLACLALLVPLCVQSLVPARPQGAPTLTVLDVGQGTSVVLRDGSHTLVYDSGGPGVAERSLIPWLRRHGVRQLDAVVISHLDDDHSAGLPALQRSFPIGNLWLGGGALAGARPCRDGSRLRFSPRVQLRFLAAGREGDSASDNNGSCVLLIDAPGLRVLLPGDIDRQRERALVAYWGEALRADVLLAGHHGSGSSSSRLWLRHVRPRHVVVSAGRGNRFGHPAARVERAVTAEGARLWNTARHGALRIAVDRDGRPRVRPTRHAWRPFWWLWRRPLP